MNAPKAPRAADATRGTRIRGLAASLALVAFAVGIPMTLSVIGAVPDPSAFSWSRLTSPDDGTLALEVITAVCWAAWAVFTLQLLASVAAQARGIQVLRIPGLAVPQLAADRWVAAAALLFVAIPTATTFLPQARADAASTAAPLPDGSQTQPVQDERPFQAAPSTANNPQSGTADESSGPRTEEYTVKRGDSLWRIAEERLGDGTRYVELVALNRAVLDDRPDFLTAGTVLNIPTDSHRDHVLTPPADETYVVQPGDTLSEIAERVTGEPSAYPVIFDASHDIVQPDGKRLTDPDLILPGWHLAVPAQASKTDQDPRRAPTVPASPESIAPAPPMSTEPPTPVTEPRAEQGGPVEDHAVTDESGDAPGWLVPGLSGASAGLAGALWIVLRQRRRTQLRYRRPGTIIASPPAELAAAEKTAYATAALVAPRIECLDAVLRSLDPSIRLLIATLGPSAIEIELAEPADLPSPWTGSQTKWEIALGETPPLPEASFPPYPLLVSVGQDRGPNHDGQLVLVNLEELRTIKISGDETQATAMARHMAAELALNPWSVVTTVDLLGLGADLAAFNLGRVRTHPAGDTDFIGQLRRDLDMAGQHEPSRRVADQDLDDFNAVIIATADRPDADVNDLAAVINKAQRRTGTVLVDLAATSDSYGIEAHITATGQLTIPALCVQVTAAGLTSDEARACALLVDLTLESTPVPVPARPEISTVADLAGALRGDLINPRPPEDRSPAGPASLLPFDTSTYTAAAATTAEDIDELAPLVRPDTAAAIQASDPNLDDDVARWESPILTASKLALLGPVRARTTGDAKDTAHRRPFYIELLAYLTLHPNGSPAAELADAFGLRPERVRVDMSHLRRWLGKDPRTGRPYLPAATAGPAPGSPALYKLDGVLCDLDLFRRLRTRGQARGADGIADLITALRMVSGEPFTDLRNDHWSWLLDGDRWDHIITSAIVDVGHIVVTHALAGGDIDIANWASHVAYTASPYDEVAQLDVIAAAKARGENHAANQELRDEVLKRRDDELAPIELPPRTASIVETRTWISKRPDRRSAG